jgi:plastocyanin
MSMGSNKRGLLLTLLLCIVFLSAACGTQQATEPPQKAAPVAAEPIPDAGGEPALEPQGAESAEEPVKEPNEAPAKEPVEETQAVEPAKNVPTEEPTPAPAPTKQPDPAEAPVVHTVEIIEFAFSPETIEIKAGDIVAFVNRDEVGHTATADDESFDTGLLKKDEEKRVTFDAAGEFSYICLPHPTMKGTIKVK